MREYVTMECTECKSRNYRTSKETRGGNRMELKKFCKVCRRHVLHRERRR